MSLPAPVERDGHRQPIEQALREGSLVLLHSHRATGYREMSPSRLASYIQALPEITGLLGARPQLWQIRQVQDNDLNLVFMVDGPGGQVCVKQAFSTVTIGGRETSLPLERTVYEEAALTLCHRISPGRVPRVLHYDSEQFLIVMERLGPHVNLRKAIVEGRVFPHLADQMGRYVAEVAFATSDFGMSALEKRERLAFFCANGELRRVTENLIFTDPYGLSSQNRWTSPELDDLVRTIRDDQELKRAVAFLKLKFMSEHQALLHGDLHTGSIMVTQSDVKVIDPEFAGFGPIGFDLGFLIGNLLAAYFSQDGHGGADAPRTASQRWLLEAVEGVWNSFAHRFLELWRNTPAGEAFPPVLFEGPGGAESLDQARTSYLRQVQIDTLRFAGACMIRRILGARPLIDFEAIPDRARRAACERRALVLARELVKDAHHVADVSEVTDVARQVCNDQT